MKKAAKILGFIIATIVGIAVIAYSVIYFNKSSKSSDNMALLGEEAPTLEVNGFRFRDLNKNGKLDAYEDSRASIEERLDDLIGQMTIEEKAGSMFVTMIGMTPDGEPLETPFLSTNPIDLMMAFALPSNSEMIARQKLNSFNT